METYNNNSVEEVSSWPKVQKLLTLVFLLVALALYFFYVKSVAAIVMEKELKNADLSSQEQLLSAKLTQLEEAGKQLELDSDVKTQQVINAIPDKLEQDNLILDLVEIAKKNDIQFNSIGFSIGDVEGVDGSLKKVGISAGFEGNYGDLVNFLKSIEQNGRKIVVENINIQLLGEPIEGVERVHFALSMQAFYRNGI